MAWPLSREALARRFPHPDSSSLTDFVTCRAIAMAYRRGTCGVYSHKMVPSDGGEDIDDPIAAPAAASTVVVRPTLMPMSHVSGYIFAVM